MPQERVRKRKFLKSKEPFESSFFFSANHRENILEIGRSGMERQLEFADFLCKKEINQVVDTAALMSVQTTSYGFDEEFRLNALLISNYRQIGTIRWYICRGDEFDKSECHFARMDPGYESASVHTLINLPRGSTKLHDLLPLIRQFLPVVDVALVEYSNPKLTGLPFEFHRIHFTQKLGDKTKNETDLVDFCTYLQVSKPEALKFMNTGFQFLEELLPELRRDRKPIPLEGEALRIAYSHLNLHYS